MLTPLDRVAKAHHDDPEELGAALVALFSIVDPDSDDVWDWLAEIPDSESATARVDALTTTLLEAYGGIADPPPSES